MVVQNQQLQQFSTALEEIQTRTVRVHSDISKTMRCMITDPEHKDLFGSCFLKTVFVNTNNAVLIFSENC